MTTSIDTILFDLGGTLFEHLPSGLTAANLAAVHSLAQRSSGCELPSDAAAYHRVRAQAEADFAARSFFLHRDLVAEAFSRYAASIGQAALVALTEAFCDRQRDTVIAELTPRDDLEAVITALRQRGVRLGIVSNIDDDVLTPLTQRWRLDTWASLLLSSEAARSCKPDRRIFEQALSSLEATPEQTLFVGDSMLNDVQGASALGMKTCLLLPPELAQSPAQARAGQGQQADEVVRSLSELGRCSLLRA